MNILSEPITSTKFIRVIPRDYKGAISMRIELYGCLSHPLLHTKPTSLPTPTDSPKEPGAAITNPNVQGVSSSKKNEYAWGQYLGISFAVVMAIVIIVSCFMWWKSSMKKGKKDVAPLVLTRYEDGSYRKVAREDEEEEAV